MKAALCPKPVDVSTYPAAVHAVPWLQLYESGGREQSNRLVERAP